MTDAYIANVVLALPFDQDAPGPNGSLDYSNYKNTLAWFGGSGLSVGQSKFGGSSAYFDGSGDYITYTVPSLLGTGDFTLEAWAYTSTVAAGYAAVVYLGVGTAGLYRKGSTFVWYQASADRITSGTISVNTWYHVAAVRSAGVVTLYIDGVALGTTYTTAYDFASTTHYLAGNSVGAEQFNGYFDDLRITKAARYTTNFTPPTAFKGDYSIPSFSGHNIPALYGKSAFQWYTLDKKGVLLSKISSHRQPNQAWWSGTGALTGLVEIGSTPVKRKVRLYESSTGVLLWEKWANDDGTYTFDTVSKAIEFTITSPDYAGIYNDVIAARVRAV